MTQTLQAVHYPNPLPGRTALYRFGRDDDAARHGQSPTP